jgi:hypothetical protein
VAGPGAVEPGGRSLRATLALPVAGLGTNGDRLRFEDRLRSRAVMGDLREIISGPLWRPCDVLRNLKFPHCAR